MPGTPLYYILIGSAAGAGIRTIFDVGAKVAHNRKKAKAERDEPPDLDERAYR